MYNTLHQTLQARTEYNKFCFDRANRDVSESLVESIGESLMQMYLLDVYPIVVDSHGVIRDGQHRFTVARTERVPFYAIIRDIPIEQVAEANKNTKQVDTKDVLSVARKMNLKPYIYVDRYICDLPETPISRVVKMNGSTIGDFLRLKFSAHHPAYAEEVKRIDLDFRKIQPHIKQSKAYRGAIEYLASCQGYDHSRMMTRMQNVPTRVVKCGKTSEALEILSSIYNYNIAAKNRIELSKLKTDRRYDESIIECSDIQPRRSVLKKENVNIYRTDNYDMFTLSPLRRSVTKKANESMAMAVAKYDMLDCFPIIVDRNCTVIDGQRRLFAARELNVPIYYIKADVSMPMTIMAGAIRRNWRIADYLKHFCEVDNPEYLKIRNFTQSKNISLDLIIRSALPAQMSYEQYQTFRSGLARFDLEKLSQWHDSILIMRGYMDTNTIRDVSQVVYRAIDAGFSVDWQKVAKKIKANSGLWTNGKLNRLEVENYIVSQST